MKQSKKKKRSRKGNSENQAGIFYEKEGLILKTSLEAFASMSMEKAVAAYREAHGDPNKAAEILNMSVALKGQSDRSPSGTCYVGSTSSSNAPEMFAYVKRFFQDGLKQKSKPKMK